MYEFTKKEIREKFKKTELGKKYNLYLLCSGIVSIIMFVSLLIIDIIFGILCILGNIIIPDLIVMFIGLLLFTYGIVETINFFIVGKEHDIENIF